MSNAIVILTYANSDEKISLLRDCIQNSKKSGFKIIISSGFQLPEDIQNSVDFVIFDKENPIITGDDLNKIGGAIFFWIKNNCIENYYCVDMNHSYAVLKLMKNAAGIAKINNIENLHYLNYDYIIYDNDVFNKQKESLIINDLYYYYYDENPNFMNTGIFSIKTDIMIESFKDVNGKNDFCDKNTPILEEFMLKTFKENNLKIEKELLINIKENNNIDVIDTADFVITRKDNGEEHNLFLYLSKNSNKDELFIVCKSTIQSKLIIKYDNKMVDPISISDITVIRVNETQVKNGIIVEVPEFKHKEIFDSDKKLSNCNIIDYSYIKNLEDYNYSKFDIIENLNINDKSEMSFYDLSMRNNTDKVYYHGYHFFYSKYLNEIRYDKFKMLEIGYGDGASMKTWSEFFPNADITVMDINNELIYSDRCRVLKGDQSKQSDLNSLINKLESTKLIIDDGSHNPIHQFDTFNLLFKNLLEPGGVYIIEDIELSYWNPDSTLYGYKSGNFNLIDSFRRYLEMINSEFTGIKNHLDISKIEFAQNCIIITKRTEDEKKYFDRNYRFIDCLDNICHF